MDVLPDMVNHGQSTMALGLRLLGVFSHWLLFSTPHWALVPSFEAMVWSFGLPGLLISLLCSSTPFFLETCLVTCE